LSPRLRAGIALLVALVATFVVWRPALDTYFFADDFLLLYDARNGAPLEFILTPYGGHLYWTRNVLFILLERLFGSDPRPYFALSLLNQLLNVGLLFAVLYTWTRRPILAGFWAALWGTCPLNNGTLTWFATHGQMMVASIVLLLLWGAAILERRGETPGRGAAWVTVAALVIGATCYGVGVGAAIAVPLAALLLFPRMTTRTRVIVCIPIVLVPVLYVAGQQIYALFAQRSTGQVATSRLLHYVPDQIVLTGHLLAHGLAGLVAGFLTPQRDLPPALVGGVGVAGALALIVAFVTGDWPVRRRLLAVFLIIGAVTGIIAVGRAHMIWMMGGTMAKAASTPRYQYLGPLFLALLAGLVCAQAARRRQLAIAGAVLAVLFLAVDARFFTQAFQRAFWRVDTHGWTYRETMALIKQVKDAVAAAPPGATVVIPNKRFASVGPVFMNTPDLFPGAAAAFITMFPADTVDGRQVRFAEADPWIYTLHTQDRRKRIAGLLVPATP
jgi:hypothetical protein